MSGWKPARWTVADSPSSAASARYGPTSPPAAGDEMDRPRRRVAPAAMGQRLEQGGRAP